MSRDTAKDSKSIYQQLRDELGLSREKAADLLGTIPPERIERIESGKFTAHPDEVVLMAEKYKYPQLCNYFCAHECEIGRKYVPEVQVKDLSRIVLEMLSGLNSIQKKQERLIEITADGVIEGNEIQDFAAIQAELENISLTVETLQLWTEQMVAEGKIDRKALEAARKNIK